MNHQTSQSVLMVDDEPHVLAGFRRTIGRSFKLDCANSGPEALKMLESNSGFAVVVSDMRMPEMSGLDFIMQARPKHRDTVFMMLTGNADQQTAVDAINRGQIFRFLNKPCSTETLEDALRAAIRQYELVTAEHVLLKETFTGSIKLMVEALEMSSPFIFAHQMCVKRVCAEICAQLGIPKDWQFTTASSLCLLGLLSLPDLETERDLTPEALEIAARTGSKLLENIPRLASVAAMIRQQREQGLLPAMIDVESRDGLEWTGSRLLQFSVDFALLRSECNNQGEAVQRMERRRIYDPRLISAASHLDSMVTVGPHYVLKEIEVDEVRAGMILETDVLRPDGTLLLSRGHTLSALGAESLINCARMRRIPPKLMVRVAQR